ncbi:MAG: 3-methyl-2-oxobutanoate hydroxymethyltransferase [Spirochaetia bacterium]|jgi:3-methyl-2-oxobutanoate hydroxymethyltransferase|nr:3-methyl-2-oxobutanoate hydroxymethyltransferase [Spirochaetia bacterium]
MAYASGEQKPFTVNEFKGKKKAGIPISMITCYDYAFACIAEQSNMDTLLVGDSLGNVIAGYKTTIPVTMDQMVYHGTIVRRGAPSKFLIVDMPFMSYHVSVEDSVRNAGRIMKETEANAVKLEGGREFKHTVEAITTASIPLVGHLGLTPQSVHKLGGYSVQGREDDKRKRLLEDALILEEAGACAIVLEMVSASLAGEISKSLSIPTIGIGAGGGCDGQVLVINDMLGMNTGFTPKFAKKFTELFPVIKTALNEYDAAVKDHSFPGPENTFK